MFCFGGAKRRRHAANETTAISVGPSLDLGLTHAAVSSNYKGKSATSCSTLMTGREVDSSLLDLNMDLDTTGREVDSSLLDLNMDFDLSLGHKESQKEVKSSILNLRGPDTINVSIDLGLSLSIGAVESDVTSISHVSSPLQPRPDIHVRPSMVQLVDEGSTSSKWRAPLLHPLQALQNMNIPMALSSYSNTTDPASNAAVLPLSTVSPLENPAFADTANHSERRKTVVKKCQFPGCTKGARGATGHCISHGGGRRCQRLGCQKGAEGRTVFCKAHGGGRRCEYLGCTKSAEGRTSFCIGHGGGTRCSAEGCTRAARGKSGYCIRHGGGKRCTMEECTKSAEGLSGLCIAHGGGRRCQYPDCKKGAQGSTKYCKSHGGGRRCSFLGCSKGAEGSTPFCKGHGGGKRCSFERGCAKSVHGGTLFCVAHGGGKRCGVPNCTKSARGKTNFCVRHGGGKRCKHPECTKSAQGSTDFCKAHGGGRKCLFGVDSAAPCDKLARGRNGFCSAHNAQLQHNCVSHMLHEPESVMSKKGKEVAVPTESVAFKGTYDTTGEGTSSGWNDFGVGSKEHYMFSTGMMPNNNLSIPEGRVHGGGLMALLRENLVSSGPSAANLAIGSPSQPVPRTWL